MRKSDSRNMTKWLIKSLLGFQYLLNLINSFIKSPIAMARALPKFDQILLMMWEESSKFFENKWCMNLVRVGCRIENIFSSIDWVSNNNDFWNNIVTCGLINTTPDGKQFGFYTHNIDCIIEGFGNGFIVDVHIRYGSSDVIFDASIYDDESMQRNTQGFDS